MKHTWEEIDKILQELYDDRPPIKSIEEIINSMPCGVNVIKAIEDSFKRLKPNKPT